MLRRGAKTGVKKNVDIPTEAYEIAHSAPELLTETEQLENELFGDIEQQFVDKEPSKPPGI